MPGESSLSMVSVGKVEPGSPLEVGEKSGWAATSMWEALVWFFEHFGPLYEYRDTPKTRNVKYPIQNNREKEVEKGKWTCHCSSSLAADPCLKIHHQKGIMNRKRIGTGPRSTGFGKGCTSFIFLLYRHCIQKNSKARETEIMACEVAKIYQHRLPHTRVTTIRSQENWDPKSRDPWGNDSSDEDIIIEEEHCFQTWLLIQTKTQATHEPRDDQGENPTSRKTGLRECSAVWWS